MNDPRVGNLTRDDAFALKEAIEATGMADSMPAWMAREIAEKTQPETETHPKFMMDALRSMMGDALTTIRAALFAMSAPADINKAMQDGDLPTVMNWMQKQSPK